VFTGEGKLGELGVPLQRGMRGAEGIDGELGVLERAAAGEAPPAAGPEAEALLAGAPLALVGGAPLGVVSRRGLGGGASRRELGARVEGVSPVPGGGADAGEDAPSLDA
jgi:hypothetical protein